MSLSPQGLSLSATRLLATSSGEHCIGSHHAPRPHAAPIGLTLGRMHVRVFCGLFSRPASGAPDLLPAARRPAGVTAASVMERALRQVTFTAILPSINVVVEESTKAVTGEDNMFDDVEDIDAPADRGSSSQHSLAGLVQEEVRDPTAWTILQKMTLITSNCGATRSLSIKWL